MTDQMDFEKRYGLMEGDFSSIDRMNGNEYENSRRIVRGELFMGKTGNYTSTVSSLNWHDGREFDRRWSKPVQVMIDTDGDKFLVNMRRALPKEMIGEEISYFLAPHVSASGHEFMWVNC